MTTGESDRDALHPGDVPAHDDPGGLSPRHPGPAPGSRGAARRSRASAGGEAATGHDRAEAPCDVPRSGDGGPGHVGPDHIGSDVAGSSHVGPEQADCEHVCPDSGGAEHVGPGHARPDYGGADRAGPDPGGADPGAVDADVAAAVRAVLARVLATRLDRARGLDTLFAQDLAERVADFTLRGGRRIRPRLLWWSLRACGGGDPAQVGAALRAGAALELLQTCALVHDDVMDAAPTRRGRPALHAAVAHQYGHGAPDGAPGKARRLGEAVAVLAGDLALAWADDTMTDLLLGGCGALPPGAVDRVRDVWRTTRTEMVAGQYLDVRGDTGRLTISHALRIACLKSAQYTVRRPLELGAALAGAGTTVTRALCRAGRCAGLAFQLRDDLDDLFADPAVTGKPSGGDVSEGRHTYVMAVARARAAEGDSAALGVLDASLGRDDLTEDALDRVRDILTVTGTRALVQQQVEQLSYLALRHLAAAGLDPGPAAALRTLLAEITGTPGQVHDPFDGPPMPGWPFAAAGAEGGR